MTNWLTFHDSITFFIAVAGFVMSIYNFVVEYIRNRTRLRVEFKDFFRFESKGSCELRCADVVRVSIVNLSNVPTVVSRVTIENKSHKGTFGTYRKQLLQIRNKTGNDVTREDAWISDILPVKIEANGCLNLLLVSDSDKERLIDLKSTNTIKLYTSRKRYRYKLNITDFSNEELLSQCREPS